VLCCVVLYCVVLCCGPGVCTCVDVLYCVVLYCVVLCQAKARFRGYEPHVYYNRSFSAVPPLALIGEWSATKYTPETWEHVIFHDVFNRLVYISNVVAFEVCGCVYVRVCSNVCVCVYVFESMIGILFVCLMCGWSNTWQTRVNGRLCVGEQKFGQRSFIACLRGDL